MKISSFFLAVIVLVTFSCQSQSNGPSERSSETVSTSPVPVGREQQRGAEILAKDTLNAVQEEVVKKPSKADDAGFKAFFQNFAEIIQRQDVAAFNQLIDPQRGLYTIETTGAMPNFYHIKDIAQHRLSNFNEPFFSIRERFQNCQLQEVKTFPQVNCEGNGDMYAQKGCFLTDGAEFQQQRIHQYASLPEAQNQAISNTLPLVSRAVLHTASGYKFYFGQVNGQWKVLFINLMAPCSA